MSASTAVQLANALIARIAAISLMKVGLADVGRERNDGLVLTSACSALWRVDLAALRHLASLEKRYDRRRDVFSVALLQFDEVSS
eukprot:426078-Prymnesium_polylepis.3